LKIIEINNSFIARKLKVNGIVIYPFILYSGIPSDGIRYHEFVHIEQIKTFGVVRFYSIYAYEYICSLLKRTNSHEAYMGVSFEKEAYERQSIFSISNNKNEILKSIIKYANT
jgi:hypothetical protein